jgi:parallel beta-helix repeat protein
MRSRNSSLWRILCLVLICGATETGHAKSVFAVTSHGSSIIKAYNINGDQIDYQAEVESGIFGDGAVGLCVWPDKELMFVTYENEGVISWASTKTLERDEDEDEISTGAGNLAGIVADEGNELLYVVERNLGILYTYTYDEGENTLFLVHPNDPCYPERKYRPLPGLNNAYGLALDERPGKSYGLLYVSNGTNLVRAYNTATWELDEVIDMERESIGIALDPNGFLYAGYFAGGEPQSHNFLLKYDLRVDPNYAEPLVEKDVGAVITGLSVDPNTRLLYTTTRRTVGQYFGTIEVYDTSNWTPSNPNGLVLTDTEYGEGIYDAAGIAVGAQYKPGPPGLHLVKTAQIENDNTCISPVDPNADEIIYEIFYWNEEDDDNEPNYLGNLDVVIVDYLPDEIDPNEVTVSDDGVYDSQRNMVTWEIGILAPGDNGSVTIEVKVIESAEPAGILTNYAEIESQKYYKTVTVDTDICCWGGDIIYVRAPAEPNAPSGVGTSWADAYTDLQDARARAAKGCGNQIWVAAGTYSPGDGPSDTFNIPEDVEIYGGFAGHEDPDVFNLDERDYAHNKTILSGYIDGVDNNNKVVSMDSGTVLDGFWIEHGLNGVYGSNVDFTITNCVVAENFRRGVFCDNGNLTVKWCVVKDNADDGIYSSGSGKNLTVNNSIISYNGENGIYCFNSTATIKNSMIFYNGEEGTVYYGVKLQNPSDNPVIRNCTIADNRNEGIYYTGSNWPDISNSIIWHNNADNGYFQLSEHCPVPTYSCITDPNDPEGEDPGADEPDEETGNISANPYFAYTNPNLADYHLDPCSPCVDAGDPCDTCDGEKDIDGDDRVLNGVDYSPDNGRVDMGADEVACDDIYNPLDWNIDAIVDMLDLMELAGAWLIDDTDPNWGDTYDKYDLYDDGTIDYADFAVFAKEWLWQPCWRESGYGVWMMMGMGGGMDKMMGAESMLISETPTAKAAAQQQASEMIAEPDIEEQIEQIKEILAWLYEIKDTIDEETWLNLVTGLEEILKELETD